MATLFSDIVEVSITAAAWKAVQIPSNTNAAKFLAKCRDNSSFLIKKDNAASRYITVPLSLAGNIDSEADRTLFYVKGTTTTTFEVLLQRKP